MQISNQIGQVSAFSGRLMLSEEGSAVRLVTLDSDAQLQLAGGAWYQLPMHQSALFNRQQILSNEPMATTESAWLEGDGGA